MVNLPVRSSIVINVLDHNNAEIFTIKCTIKDFNHAIGALRLFTKDDRVESLFAGYQDRNIEVFGLIPGIYSIDLEWSQIPLLRLCLYRRSRVRNSPLIESSREVGREKADPMAQDELKAIADVAQQSIHNINLRLNKIN